MEAAALQMKDMLTITHAHTEISVAIEPEGS